MNIMDGIYGLVKAASLLRGDARTAYLINEMQNERANRKAIDSVFGPETTREADGTVINWNPRPLPTGAFQMPKPPVSSETDTPAPDGVPRPPEWLRGVNPQMKAQGMAELRQRLAATGAPMFRYMMAKQAFELPKPPQIQKLGANEIAGYADDNNNWVEVARNAAPERPPEETELAKYQRELDAFGPNDPRRSTWQAKIKRLSEGEPKDAKTNEPPAGYRFRPDGNLEAIPGGPADKPKDQTIAPAGYRWAADGTALEVIQGGPADVGQKGLPQAYKEAKAGIKTLRGSLKAFRDKFAGTPARIDPETGKMVPATSGTGTEMGGASAGELDNMHTQILLGTKTAESLGALDKGAMDVAEKMVRNPTGFLSPFQRNSYTTAQIDSYLKYLDEKEANLDQSYQAGTWRPPQKEGEPSAPPEGRRYIGFTPDGKRVYTENGENYVEE